MSNPSFENIDKWLFEYMEGNLSPSQVAQLETFMLNNPEFEPDMDAWQYAKVDPTPAVYPGVIGRKRKPVPFWLVSSLALTSVFVAGTLFGAYVNTSEPESLQAESVARTQEHTFKSSTELHAENITFPNRIFNQNEVSSDMISEANSFSDQNYTRINSKKALINSDKRNSIDKAVTQFTVEKDVAKELGTKLKGFDALEGSDIAVQENPIVIKNMVKIHKEAVPEMVNPVMKEIQKESLVDNNLAINDEKSINNNPRTEITNNRNKEDTETVEARSSDKTAKEMTRGQERMSVNYNKSFSLKIKSTVRKIIRMTENPIALTNSKDIYYHVPNMQTLNVNSATAGNLLRPRIQMTSRAQWTGHSNQQILSELSYDTYVKSIRGGIGVQMSHGYYNQGTYNVGQLALTYSPKFTVNKNFSIEPAIRLKMGDKRLNSQNLVPGQVIEMERRNERIFYTQTPENPVKDLWYKDVALALSSNTKWFSVGFQMDNIGRHFNNVYNSNEPNERSGVHYTATLGTDFVSRSKIFSLSPYILCQKVENLSEIWGGSIFRYNKMTFGGGISSSGDYAGSIGVKTDRFMLTYNADMTRSNLIGTRLFSQQLTIRILMNKGRMSRLY